MRLTHHCRIGFSSILSQDSWSHSRFLYSAKQSYDFHYTEEVLASHIAPLLEHKNSSHSLQLTQQIHAQFTVNGLLNKGILGTRILGVYITCNNYFDAKKLFWQLNLRYASPWNWMIRGFTQMGRYDYGVLFYFKMLSYGTNPDKYTFPYLIKACGGLRAVDLVKYVHGMIKDLGFELDVYVGSALVNFYTENDCLDNARNVFDKLPQRDVVLWNGMLNGYLKFEGLEGNLIGLFEQMRKGEVEPNAVTYTCILKLCGLKSMLKLGAQVHGLVMRCGLDMQPSVANTLVALYAKCCCLSDARKLFELVEQANLVTWNTMIGGFVQNGFMNEALDLFRGLMCSDVKPDSVTFASLLPLVPELNHLNLGKEIHCYIVRNAVCVDLFLTNALIDMYFKCKDADMARKVFEQSSAMDIVICTAMISGLALNGMNGDALEIFRCLVSKKMAPNAVTFASTLPACAGLTALALGKELHGNIIRRGLEGRCYIGSALTDMYAKCGRLDLGHRVFVRTQERDSVCWNSIIMNCSQNGKPEVAMEIFRDMGLEGASYDCVSISAALSACASLSSLRHGKELHGFMVRGGFDLDLFASSALIDVYAKCGNLELAQRVFDVMESRNEVSWNSIIAAYGNHGHLHQCLALFNAMEGEGYEPDSVTFLAIMSACGHTGEVEQGKRYFNLMIQEYEIPARREHYACLIDMLGRAGRVGEALKVMGAMPFSPDAGVWGALLGACRIHGEVELAEVASEHLFRLDPQNSGYYMLLSNLHADSGTWGRVDEIRGIMKERGVQKIPGYSWIQVNNFNHVFAAADKNHPHASQIYCLLDHLLVELQDEGYFVPFLKFEL
ncbi:pentatricopeptide repeat-containing protein At4g21300 [Salvia miltiorrhiza]|uniref:pentatricopeptide repeat-containing protein At4g21300 n=1 Tax=Salvia miltiorrhiza TaxID=226208 RepID=UPI0025AB7CC5|nr:pentatricopeptide repeat-containing protein At4g21300 [Salvia miltiorrhiza]XP_057812167.1 pentatricopeptide repeat-containing protein At4g21300 [Salvia miltiorrhiza]